MGLPAAQMIPLEEDFEGVLKVSGTRITLDTVIYAFLNGATPEEIVQQYSSINLADIYYILGYYLHNQPEVESYLQIRQQERIKVREQNEAQFAPQGIRDRLTARPPHRRIEKCFD
jgi:uncharacterized protein (DUF433 family)